ncbi:bile acid:sodium symporter family protein [Fulvivirga sp. M361]|uniref:bile acid:sodium symporter family protein n=1 Tax=Fulvivirga sp. M361 TaxID=2594266 RepID=UPI001179D7F6|nr:bile acid:sodium symporter family protein [Fulvivirga sp. M361]TRX61850.1 bile acid:sodium symporter family protein [Fulvivirga sp. M361]
MDGISTAILAISLIIIMLGMGLSLETDDFRRILKYPKAIMVGLVNQLLILPLLAFGVASLIPVAPEIAVGIMILAACPGGPTSNLIAHLAKGDTALSVSLTAISSFITIITIPFVVNFGMVQFFEKGQMVELNVVQTIVQNFVIIVIPVCTGMFIRRKREAFANKMSEPVRKASGVVIALVIIGLIIKEKDHVVPYFQQAGFAALVLNVTTMMVGFYSAKLFKITDRRAISISIESGIQNGTMAIAIAVVLLGNATFAIAPAIYSLLMFFTGGAVVYLGIKRSKAALADRS